MQFDTVVGKVDQPALETEILSLWEKNRTFEKLVEKTKNGKPWLLLDGPVTANNRLGVHHGWGRTYKDIYQRFNAMRGHRCRWQNGFDCHGLWVEVEVEKDHFMGKKDIDFDVQRFVEKCQERTIDFAERITQQSIRLGQWNDWANSYRTDSTLNVEAIWHFLKMCNHHKLLKKDFRVMPWCTRCGTSLSQHEMADSYKDVEDTAITFICPLFDGEHLLVWTTTPWTLRANTALAVNPKLMYSLLSTASGKVWMSKAVKDRDYPDIQPLREEPGTYFLGKKYWPPFRTPGIEYIVIPWEDIDATVGTGIVHIAPGFGVDDYALWRRYNLEERDGKYSFHNFVPVDESGCYNAPYGEGEHWKTVNEETPKLLWAKSLLIKEEKIIHSYPHCWRCKEPLIFRQCQEWFILTGPLRDRLKAAAEDIFWKPYYIFQQMNNWLDNMGDWCISRRRYWGVPLPIYPCECGTVRVVGHMAELRAYAKDREKFDAMPHPHRPWIDGIEIVCKHCHKPVKRIEAVGDCWLDAGIVPFSTTSEFPNDLACEMREQVRLWFYSALLMSVVLRDKAPFDTICTYDEMRDSDGEKFSKTKGNSWHLERLVSEDGADVLRHAFASAPVDSVFLFGDGPLKEARKFLNMLWNCWNYFAQNANNDMPMHLGDPAKVDGILDRWMLTRLDQTIVNVTKSLKAYDAKDAIEEIGVYVNDLSTWYIRLQRPLFVGGDKNEKRTPYNILWTSFRHLALLLAPIMPFTAEALWQKCRKYDYNMAESVHLWNWPQPDGTEDVTLCKDMNLVRDIVQIGLALRNGCKTRIRQPLESLTIDGMTPETLPDEMRRLIMQELNVESIVHEKVDMGPLLTDPPQKWGDKDYAKSTCHELRLALKVTLTDDLRAKGAIREVIRAIQDQRKKIGMVMGDDAVLYIAGTMEQFALDVGMTEISKKCGLVNVYECIARSDGEIGWFDVETFKGFCKMRLLSGIDD